MIPSRCTYSQICRASLTRKIGPQSACLTQEPNTKSLPCCFRKEHQPCEVLSKLQWTTSFKHNLQATPVKEPLAWWLLRMNASCRAGFLWPCVASSSWIRTLGGTWNFSVYSTVGGVSGERFLYYLKSSRKASGPMYSNSLCSSLFWRWQGCWTNWKRQGRIKRSMNRSGQCYDTSGHQSRGFLMVGFNWQSSGSSTLRDIMFTGKRRLCTEWPFMLGMIVTLDSKKCLSEAKNKVLYFLRARFSRFLFLLCNSLLLSFVT